VATGYALDFVGAGVSVASSGGVVTATITGGAAAPVAFSTYEKDLGSVPLVGGTFDITGLSGLTTNKPVLIWQAVGPYTNKGDATGSVDEAEMDQVVATAYCLDTTTIRVYWECERSSYVAGYIKFNYLVGA
jgi:hypothetical protein